MKGSKSIKIKFEWESNKCKIQKIVYSSIIILFKWVLVWAGSLTQHVVVKYKDHDHLFLIVLQNLANSNSSLYFSLPLPLSYFKYKYNPTQHT